MAHNGLQIWHRREVKSASLSIDTEAVTVTGRWMRNYRPAVLYLLLATVNNCFFILSIY